MLIPYKIFSTVTPFWILLMINSGRKRVRYVLRVAACVCVCVCVRTIFNS